MKTFISRLVILAISVLATDPACAAVIFQQSESFDTNPGWTSQQNPNPPNNYGFTNVTHFTGSTAGEAGGTYGRTNTFSYFADTDLGMTFGATNQLSASGKLTFNSNSGQQGGIRIGYFDNTDYPGGGPLPGGGIAGSNDFVGVIFQEPNGGSGGRFRAVLRMVKGSGSELEQTFPTSTGALTGFDYNFNLLYDPLANAGNGRLSLTLTGIDDLGFSTNIFLNLPAGFISTGSFAFNSFGISALNFSGDNGTSTLFLDDLIYTAAIPEPSTMLLMAAGGAILWRRRRAAGKQ